MSRAGNYSPSLSEIARLHLDRINVQVGDVDVARSNRSRRLTARVRGWRTMVEFVAAPMRQWKGRVALNRPGFTGGQNSRRVARYGTDIKEEDLEAVFT